MLVPLFIKSPLAGASPHASRIESGVNVEAFCSASFATFSTPSTLGSAVTVHTLGHFLVAGLVAIVVYEKLGVAILRRAWFNLDLLWTIALMATGVFIVVM